MHSLDTLEVAKQEGRAPWTDVHTQGTFHNHILQLHKEH